MRLPWRHEVRESSYTDTLIASLIRAQAGASTVAIPTATGALEACVGIVGRAFASAEVEGSSSITPALLSMIARDLLRKGESVHLIDVAAGAVQLLPASAFDVAGRSPSPTTWTYRLDLAAPDGNAVVSVGAESVVHVRYAVEAARPWRGLSPLQVTSIAGRLSSETAQALADESGSPHGSFLPLPTSEDESMKGLRSDVKGSKGDVLLVESMAAGWGAGAANAPQDWGTKRFGAAPPAALVALHEQAFSEVVSAVGVPPILFSETASGAGVRKGWRQLLMGLIRPLAKLTAAELSAKLERPISLTFDALAAVDIQGRARAYKALTEAGIDAARAEELAGLFE